MRGRNILAFLKKGCISNTPPIWLKNPSALLENIGEHCYMFKFIKKSIGKIDDNGIIKLRGLIANRCAKAKGFTFCLRRIHGYGIP